MVKPTPATGPGVYSATYSGIPVYEFQFGTDLKEHVMRRRHDDWVNATHILKAAGFDKPARTRILERDVQKDVHEKIQGGNVDPFTSCYITSRKTQRYRSIKTHFRIHTWQREPASGSQTCQQTKKRPGRDLLLPNPAAAAPPPPPVADEYSNGGDTLMGEDDIPDNLTIASASYMAEDDRFDLSQITSTGHRKRKREEQLQELTEQQHSIYGDELLDYFLLSRNEQPTVKPEPPPNFQPDWIIDSENHTALHWASAMGDVDVIKQLRRFNANVAAKNIRGETPLMRSVNFTNCFEKRTFPAVMKELFETADVRDSQGCTVIHHAAIMKNGRVYSPSCSRYYLDIILNKLQESLEHSAFQQLLDAQDNEGNTALHLAARLNARKCIRSLLGRHASTDVVNNEGVRVEDLIMELNASKRERGPQRSSSPFAPESQRHNSFRDAFLEKNGAKPSVKFSSTAATTVHSRITPLIIEKFQDLAKSYDDEWHQKEVAETEAQRILSNTQAELEAARRQIAEMEEQIESEEAAAKMMSEANRAKHQVTELITYQNRQHIQKAVEEELSKTNGDSMQEESYEERLSLAQQLAQLLADQRQAETEYVDALAMVGTGDKIEKYRKLLKTCLEPKDGESLDMNLDSVVDMVEEQRAVHDMDGGPDCDAMDFHI
uniref:HTH APSES-type domain-containing protein n=1 Tax=Bionectria ochroleuca TaxID=29856 RepID=A0A8H7N3F9_BIOOC